MGKGSLSDHTVQKVSEGSARGTTNFAYDAKSGDSEARWSIRESTEDLNWEIGQVSSPHQEHRTNLMSG